MTRRPCGERHKQAARAKTVGAISGGLMDFTEDEVVTDVRQLANDVFTRRVSEDRLRAIDASSPGHDEALWDGLARSGLLGIGIGEAHGGGGLGWAACCAGLAEQATVV